MIIETQEKPVIIKLSPGESVAVASTIVVHTNIIKCTNKTEVIVKVYSDFFVIIEKTNGKTVEEAYSDNWDFHIRRS